MDTYRLRIKIGTAEFEAEGPEESVKEQFEAFKQLIQSSPSAINTPATSPSSVSRITQIGQEALEAEPVRRLYIFSKGGDFLSLAFPPRGEERHQQALLLVLYGFRKLLGQDDVAVGVVKDSLEQSGFVVDRVDRIASPLTKAGLVWKGGKKGKGGKYRLTNLGFTEAEATVKGLLEQAT